MNKEKNHIHKNFKEYYDFLEKKVDDEISGIKNEKKDNDSFVMDVEGPNIMFRTQVLQYLVTGMRFKNGTTKTEYGDLLGSNSILVELRGVEDIKKIEKAYDSVVGLLNSGIYAEEYNGYLKML